MLENIEEIAREYVSVKQGNRNYKNGLLGCQFFNDDDAWEFSFGLIDGKHYCYVINYAGPDIEIILEQYIKSNYYHFSKGCHDHFIRHKLLTLHDRSYYMNIIFHTVDQLINTGIYDNEELVYMRFLLKMIN